MKKGIILNKVNKIEFLIIVLLICIDWIETQKLLQETVLEHFGTENKQPKEMKKLNARMEKINMKKENRDNKEESSNESKTSNNINNYE